MAHRAKQANVRVSRHLRVSFAGELRCTCIPHAACMHSVRCVQPLSPSYPSRPLSDGRFAELAPELVLLVARFLCAQDLLALAHTCRRTYACLAARSLWRALYRQVFRLTQATTFPNQELGRARLPLSAQLHQINADSEPTTGECDWMREFFKVSCAQKNLF